MDVLLIGVDIDGSVVPASLTLPQLAAFLVAQPDLRLRLKVRTRSFTTSQTSRQMSRSLARARADLVGFSAYVWSEPLLRPVIKKLRSRLPGATFLVGGPQVKGRERDWLRTMPELDAVVTGEGEGPLADVARRLLSGKSLRGIANTSVPLKGGGVHIEPARPPLPFSTFAEVPSANLAGQVKLRDGLAYVETVRGCPFGCAFCDFGHQSRRLRRRTLAAVEEELCGLRRAGARHLVFVDPVFNADRRRALAILSMVRALGFGSVSVQLAVELVDDAVAAALAHFGCIAGLGLQSTDPTVCRLMHRRWEPERFAKGVAALRRHDVPFKIQLICGLPGDTYRTFCRSVDDALGFGPVAVEAFVLQVLPGTAFYQSAQALGLRFEREPPHRVLSTDLFTAPELERARMMSMAIFKLHVIAEFRGAVGARVRAGRRPSAIYQWLASQALETGLVARDALLDPRAALVPRELEGLARLLRQMDRPG